MGIVYNPDQTTFHLQGKNFSYLMKVFQDKYLIHLYYGKKIRSSELNAFARSDDRAFGINPDPQNRKIAMDLMRMEYPSFGHLDFRYPAVHLSSVDGSTVTDLHVKSFQIHSGKKPLAGLPSTYIEQDDEAETLEMVLEDSLTSVEVILSYTVFNDRDVMTRSARVINRGNQPVTILQALSMSLDFADDRFEMLQLSGAWARERMALTRPLLPGIQSVESRRGASSHQHNPFIALLRPGTTETVGEVYGFSLVYSGNFIAQAEVSEQAMTRVSLGINPFNFSWRLESGEAFQTPEAVMVYSDQGLGGMSRMFHRLLRERLCRGAWRDRERPMLINNWEATYFDFTDEKLLEIAACAQKAGMELFVLDDGWFGERCDDRRALGDWVVNEKKLKRGLRGLAEDMEALGLAFGLWFEPEMVSPDSDLYRRHPDWCLHVPGRERMTTRSQLILDLSRTEVCDAVETMIGDVLASAPIAYIKWDMNRNMTDVGSVALPPERQRETAHRYMLNLYAMLERLTTRFPHILFESCSGGGGRFDPGMLYFMPQTWTSDDTDAIERLKIQYGTSIVYPAVTMGAHVSAVPNHQVGRVTPLATRGHVAMAGNLGYELDLSRLSSEELEEIKAQTDSYRQIRRLVQFGDYYRLLSPFEGEEAAWMFVAPDRGEAVVCYCQTFATPNSPFRTLRLQGLDPEADYRIQGEERIFAGDELLYAGLSLPMVKDFGSVVYKLEKVNQV